MFKKKKKETYMNEDEENAMERYGFSVPVVAERQCM